MKKIPLSEKGWKNKGKYFTTVDDEDFEYLNQWKWSFSKFYVDRIDKKNRRIRMHRLIMNCPKKMEIDHINGDELDNRKENLRIVTRQQNQMNRKKLKGKSSIYKGVIWIKRLKKWRAAIEKNNKSMYIGVFNNERQAAMAYDIAAHDLFGKYAKLNFPYGIHG